MHVHIVANSDAGLFSNRSYFSSDGAVQATDKILGINGWVYGPHANEIRGGKETTRVCRAFGTGHAVYYQCLVRVQLAPASNPKQDGERLGYVSFAKLGLLPEEGRSVYSGDHETTAVESTMAPHQIGSSPNGGL